MPKKRALITGIRGQDGAYLARNLLDNGYEVYGADRRSADATYWRLRGIGAMDDVKILHMDLLEITNVYNIIEKIRPDEVYNLAAQSFVATSFEQPILTADINAIGVLRLLEALRRIVPGVKFYQASTSELFGKVQTMPQNEKTPFHPRSPYGIAKLFAHWSTINYREAFGMFACNGILFNHESPFRGMEFVSRKISHAVARIKHGKQDAIILGNLDAKRDWGFAGDYVEGMRLILAHEKPEDFVLATGETHSIREFAETAFACVGTTIEWTGAGEHAMGLDAATGRVLVKVSSEFYRPAEVDILLGDASKARDVLGWKPKVNFSRLVEMMVEFDLKNVEMEGA